MTEASYLADSASAYVRSFRARVVARPPGAVVLDRTYFYPEGGGQPSDRGSLVGSDGTRVPVLDVRRTGSTILHRLGRATPPTGAPLAIGAEILGEIDWDRRHRLMRLHTVQHLASGIIFTRLHLRTLAAVIGVESAVLDLESTGTGAIEWNEIAEAVRAEIRGSRRVAITFVPRTEWVAHPAPRAGVAPIPAHVDPVRIIDIEGSDRCPCGGTHVASTAEIGEIELAQREAPAGGGGPRVELFLRPRSSHSERVTP
ncbi:MAG: alanyl-tRNA editing protein [Thermoplasmata archaeon]|nr:alanyl-tRNA editing protein [Thermoplasmata archaeon]